MKLSTTLFASAAVILGIAACAAPSSDEGDETASTTQALCRRGTCDARVGGGSSSGRWSSSGLVAQDDPPSFSCVRAPGAKNCLDPGYLALSCNPQNKNECVCIQGCGGGGWPYGTFNPCPSFAPRYVCNAYGSCRCY